MMDFAAARQFMVQGQVRINDVTDPRLTSAMLEVPRERFVPPELGELAYLDRDLPVTPPQSGPPRFLIKPLVVAQLLQAAAVAPDDRVLDIGCATGYAAALLARLGRSVIALEEDSGLASAAAHNLKAFGVEDVSVVTGPLNQGWPADAPYNVILVEGRCETVPQPLLAQLADGGRLVCVQGHATAAKGMIYRSVRGDVSGWPQFDAAASLLPGFAQPAVFAF